MKNEYETLTVKRMNNSHIHKDNINIYTYCDCCNKPSDFLISMSKKKKKKIEEGERRKSEKIEKKLFLCSNHAEKLKEILNFF